MWAANQEAKAGDNPAQSRLNWSLAMVTHPIPPKKNYSFQTPIRQKKHGKSQRVIFAQQMQRTHASKARGKLEQTRKWFLSFLINIKGHPECHIYIFSFRRIYGKGKKGTNSCLGWSWKKEWHLSSKLSKNQILPSSQSPLTTSHAKSLLSLMCNLWAYPQPRTHSPLRQCRDNDY